MPYPGPHQARAKEIYTELRANLIENIFKVRFFAVPFTLGFFSRLELIFRFASQEYQSTGYVWEQYDALTGEGSRRFVLSFSSTRLVRLSCFSPTRRLTRSSAYSRQSSFHRMDLSYRLEYVSLSPSFNSLLLRRVDFDRN